MSTPGNPFLNAENVTVTPDDDAVFKEKRMVLINLKNERGKAWFLFNAISAISLSLLLPVLETN